MPLTMLFSCGGGDAQDGLTLFKSRYDNGKYFEDASKSQTDETKIYMTTIAVSNHRDSEVTFTVSDFKMSFDDKEYTPVFFVLDYQMNSITINGVTVTQCYVTNSVVEYTVPVTTKEMTNLTLAFEGYTESEFKLEYKGSEIASI